MKRIHKMKKIENTKSRWNVFGWAILGVGILLFVTGILLRTFSPGTIADSRSLEGLGILAIGWGIIPLVNNLSAKLNPVDAHRKRLAGEDERAVALRNQAAYVTFLFTLITTSIILVGYSAFTRGQNGFDPVWFILAFLVIVPTLVFVGVLSWLNRA
jgi:hypothetical protein